MKGDGRARWHGSRVGTVASIGGTITVIVIIIVGAAVYLDSRGTTPSTVSPHASILYASSPGTSPSSGASAKAGAALVNVTIQRGSSKDSGSPGFSPDTLALVVGINNTVIWTNDDNATHVVAANDNLFNSGGLDPGKSFTYTFSVAGTYTYTDTTYSWMRGTIVVVG